MLHTTTLSIIVARIELSVIVGKVNASNEKVVLFIRSMRAENKAVHGIVFAFGSTQEMCDN